MQPCQRNVFHAASDLGFALLQGLPNQFENYVLEKTQHTNPLFGKCTAICLVKGHLFFDIWFSKICMRQSHAAQKKMNSDRFCKFFSIAFACFRLCCKICLIRDDA